MIVGDASYFVALADRKDRWHADALRIRRREPPQYLVTDLTVAEAVTVIGGRRGGKPARTLYEFFVDTCDIEFVERDLLEEAMAHHLRYDGVLSVPDCVSVTLMDRREIREIASFDADFDNVRGIRRIH